MHTNLHWNNAKFVPFPNDIEGTFLCKQDTEENGRTFFSLINTLKEPKTGEMFITSPSEIIHISQFDVSSPNLYWIMLDDVCMYPPDVIESVFDENVFDENVFDEE